MTNHGKWLWENAEQFGPMAVVSDFFASAEPIENYLEFCETAVARLVGKSSSFPSRHQETPCDLIRFLKQLIYRRLFETPILVDGVRMTFTRSEIEAEARKFIVGDGVDADTLMARATASALFGEIAAGEYAFAHSTIGEYLAAKALVERNDYKSVLCRACFDPVLVELDVLPIALGLVPKPDDVYDTLNQLPESLNFANLRLRARGLAYVSRLDQRIVDELAKTLARWIELKNVEDAPSIAIVLRAFCLAQLRFRYRFASRLLKLARESNSRIRVVWALGHLGVKSPEVVDELVSSLWGGDSYERGDAALALERLGIETPEVVAQLGWVRRYSHIGREFEELREKALKSSEKIPDLLANLVDRGEFVRSHAAWKLGEFGVSTLAVIEGLFDVFRNDEKQHVRKVALAALARLNAPNITTYLLDASQDGDRSFRGTAATSLGDIPENDLRIVPALIGLLQDDDECVRFNAARALVRRGVNDPEVVACLLEALRDENEGIRGDAAKALGELGSGTPEILSALLEEFRDGYSEPPEKVESALIRLGAGNPTVTAGLLAEYWDCNEWGVQFGAARILEKFSLVHFCRGLKTVLDDQIPSARRKATQIIGYYADDLDVLEKLRYLAEHDPDDGVRDIARDAVPRYERKLRLFGILPSDSLAT